jgi:arylsulfatase A-like enzyme
MNYDRTDPGFLKPTHGRLNVVQIMCDQLPYYALGCYGHPLIQTPHVNGLAERGVLFTNAYAQNPVCCPSRASQLSGLYPANHGLLDNQFNVETLNPNVRFLSDRFYEEGYASAHFGKWHCLRRHTDAKFTEFKFLEESVPIWPQEDLRALYGRAEDPAFVEFAGLVHAATHPCTEENTGPARITDYSIDFVERFAYRPFFLRVSYLGPHAPVLVPRPYDTMYNPDDVELPDYDFEEFANRPEAVRRFQQRSIEVRSRNLGGLSARQAIQTHVAYNLGMISHIDDQIGRLVSKIQEMGLTENTVILFSADHGGFWGEHGLLEKALCTHYRNLLQLPLIISCPGTIPQGEKCEGFVEEVDFYPTLLDLADIEQEYKVNGRSLREALHGGSTGREDVYAEAMSTSGHHTASLRDAHWNLVWHSTGEVELYDMHDDPAERFNLGDDARYEDVIETLTRRLLLRTMNNRNVQFIPGDDRPLDRSPIYLTPGRDERGHRQASVSRYRHPERAGDIDWFPRE